MSNTSPSDNFWRHFDVSASSASECSNINLYSYGEIEAKQLSILIEKQGFQVNSHHEAALNVVLVQSIGDQRIGKHNLISVRSKTPLLVVQPTGLEIEFAFFNHTSACWACFESRHKLLDGPATYLNNSLSLSSPAVPPLAYTPASLRLAYDLFSLIICRVVRTDETANLSGFFYTLDISNLETRRYPITKIPHCHICGQKSQFPVRPQLVLHRNMINS